MRTLKIGALAKSNFIGIVDKLLYDLPGALVSWWYDTKFNIGFFVFQESDLIPECMKTYVIDGPDKEKMRRIENSIKPLMKWELNK